VTSGAAATALQRKATAIVKVAGVIATGQFVIALWRKKAAESAAVKY
jgi:hypothetical protein